jgi:phosphosulfolactate synthase (CoM biosynthesis protein A)
MSEPNTSEPPLSFLLRNPRMSKPRSRGVTEIRGPYYSVVGPRYLADLLETAGDYVDTLKFAGGSFALLPRGSLREMIELCHAHDVRVSTGGFVERVLAQGASAVDRYFEECRELGFDMVEISSGFVTVPADDLITLASRARASGLHVKPEVGIQFGAGGGSSTGALEAEGTRGAAQAITLARRYLDAGAEMIMIESEGITENVRQWRVEVIVELATQLGLEKLMFEAADPEVFGWYVKTYGPEVNLFVDHSQILQLECLRAGLWGTKDLWGRVLTYKTES